ncbi:UNVERIFIED_CONTAM: hypothetical protein FKN15_025963 [Acipenser sinensis]
MLDKSPAGQDEGSRFNGFYAELRKKYPSAFTLAGDLGKDKLAALKKLPSLGPRPILKPEAFPDNLAHNPALLGRQASHAFLLKVENERSEQRSSAEKRPSSGRPRIVKGNRVVVPAAREQALNPGKQLRLPSVSNRIKQNRAALRNHLNNWVPHRALSSGGGPALQSQSSPGGGGIEHAQTAPSGWNSFSERSEDVGSGSEVKPPTLSPHPRVLSSALAELLLPNKPKLELRTRTAKSRLSVSDSDGDSGISLGFPAFRPKDPFTLNPLPCLSPRSGRLANQREPRSGPLKADHTIAILSRNSTLMKRTLKTRVKRMQGPKNNNDYIDHTQRGGAVESSSNQRSAQSKKEQLYAVTEGAPPAVQEPLTETEMGDAALIYPRMGPHFLDPYSLCFLAPLPGNPRTAAACLSARVCLSGRAELESQFAECQGKGRGAGWIPRGSPPSSSRFRVSCCTQPFTVRTASDTPSFISYWNSVQGHSHN